MSRRGFVKGGKRTVAVVLSRGWAALSPSLEKNVMGLLVLYSRKRNAADACPDVALFGKSYFPLQAPVNVYSVNGPLQRPALGRPVTVYFIPQKISVPSRLEPETSCTEVR